MLWPPCSSLALLPRLLPLLPRDTQHHLAAHMLCGYQVLCLPTARGRKCISFAGCLVFTQEAVGGAPAGQFKSVASRAHTCGAYTCTTASALPEMHASGRAMLDGVQSMHLIRRGGQMYSRGPCQWQHGVHVDLQLSLLPHLGHLKVRGSSEAQGLLQAFAARQAWWCTCDCLFTSCTSRHAPCPSGQLLEASRAAPHLCQLPAIGRDS